MSWLSAHRRMILCIGGEQGSTRCYMQIVSWQKVLTEHQVHTWRSVAAIPGVRLAIVTRAPQEAQRASQGWRVPDKGELLLEALPPDFLGSVRRGLTLVRSHWDAVHVFNTMWEDKAMFWVFCYCVAKRRRVVVVSEPYSPLAIGYLADENPLVSRAKALVRNVSYASAGLIFGRRVSAVLGISRLSCDQFARNGFRPDSIFPFGYFIKQPALSGGSVRGGGMDKLRAVYVGSLIKRKGHDVAAAAVEALVAEGRAVELDVYGPASHAMRAFGAGVHYKGPLAFGTAVEVMSRYDVVIVPSRHDGWSVAVNEAIFAGTPVLVSKFVGAKDVIEENSLGLVFDGTVAGLKLALKRVMLDRVSLSAFAANQATFAARLDPDCAAGYLLAVLRHVQEGGERPVCPWYTWPATT